MAFILALLICLSIILSNVKFTPTFDKVFNDPNCVDSYGLDLYQQLVPNISIVRKSAVAIVIMSAVSLTMLIIYSCISYFKTSESLYN